MAMNTITIVNGRRNENSPTESSAEIPVLIDGSRHTAQPGERLVDPINRVGLKLSQECYHHHLGPIQTSDTYLVEIGGQLLRACATTVTTGISVTTASAKAHAARQDA